MAASKKPSKRTQRPTPEVTVEIVGPSEPTDGQLDCLAAALWKIHKMRKAAAAARKEGKPGVR